MPPARLPFEFPTWIACPACKDTIWFNAERIPDYFKSIPLICPKCQTSNDWWSTACKEIENNFMFSQAFVFVGARTSFFKLLLRNGQQFRYKYSDYGIPVDAKILYVNYTPCGELAPYEWHGGCPTRKMKYDEVVGFPVPITDNKAPADTEVNVMVSWVPTSISDDSFQNLVDAFEAYSIDRYTSMVVPANVAVESALSQFLNKFIKQFVGKKITEDFLETAATYGHQLNVLLPFISGLLKLPNLPDHVRGSLNRLRKCRNQIAHSGVLESQIDKRAAAEMVCGALFGFHYVRFLDSALQQSSIFNDTESKR
jgi:hypothetical protein